MNNVYIGPRYLENTILNKLLENNDFINFKYIDINEYVNSFLIKKDELNDVKNKLLKIKNDFKFYNKLFDNDKSLDSFIEEVIGIKDKLVKYNKLFNLDIDSLAIDEELKTILNLIEIDYNFDIPLDTSNITIININYSLVNDSIVSKLLSNGAKTFEPDKKENKSFIYETKSIRDEMEFVVQYIINNKLNLNDCGVVLADNSNINLFKTVLNHYNVPYFTKHRSINSSALKMVSVLDYVVNPNTLTYRNLVNTNLLTNSNEAINKYLIDHIELNDNLLSEFKKFDDEDNDSYFKKLEIKANKIHNVYIKFLKDIKDIESFDLLFRRVIEYLPKNDDTKALVNKINTFSIDDCNLDNYETIKKELLSLKESQKDYKSALYITDLKDPIINKDYLFVLDVVSDNYPGFKPLNSILKEEDIENTNYPSLIERKENLLKILEYLNYSKETIYVYPISSYEGKIQKLSYEIMTKNLETINFNLNTYENEHYESHHISEKSIKTNHIIDNQVSGSVSRFEAFVSCPYSYFVRCMLGLREPDTQDINAATTGTLIHAVMQQLVETKGKDYPNYKKEDIEKIISKNIDELRKHYPNKTKLIDFLNQRIVDSLMLEQHFLKEAELETSFKPYQLEKEINYPLKTNNGITINIKGYIDRVDTKDNFFRIIDYKTSSHTITKKSFEKGNLLQLCTYAYIYKELTNKIPHGVFYLALNHESTIIDMYEYQIKKGFIKAFNTEFDKFIQAQKLRPFIFNEAGGLYIEPKCIAAIKKDFTFKDDHSYNYDDMKTKLIEFYSNIIENILKGDFNPKYDKNNCKYCSYSTMCHNKYLFVSDDEEDDDGESNED